MKRPSFQFYPADWRKDTALQFCSLQSRGLWVEMMCIAHECEPYGYLMVNGKAMTNAQIGRHAVPSSAYPKLSCLFRQEYVEPHDHCVRFQVQPTQ